MPIDNTLPSGVNLIGYFGKGFGLGETSRLMAETLKQAEIPFSLISANDFVGASINNEPFSYPIDNVFKYPVNLFTIDPSHIAMFIERRPWDLFKSRYNIGLVFWETTAIDWRYLNGWRYLDEIWTTSRFMHEIFFKLTSVPVHHISQPIEINYPNPQQSKTALGIPDRFTFLFCFDFCSILGRKNPQAIIEAFQMAFPNQENVQLVIKSKEGASYPDQLEMMQKKIQGDSRLIWIDKAMDGQARFNLMNNCDCYISLHRSEGFGLTMAEAMLLEKPVIATGYSGNMDFMNLENSYLCSFRFVPVGKGNDPYPPEAIWAEPDVHHAARLMRRVMENRDEALTKARKGREFIQNHHTFKQTGTVVAEKLKDIQIPLKNKSMPWRYVVTQCERKAETAIKPVKNVLERIKNRIKRFYNL